MNRILIIGATGYIGKYMAKASVSLGYPTFAFVRPSTAAPHCSKSQLLQQFRDDGIIILQGSLDDHNSLVNAIKQVDIVISAVAIPQHLDQLNIIKAIKEAGNIKRFLPSEFGNEVDRIKSLAPFQRINDVRKTIRRATEEAGIPYTFVSANSYAAYFIDYFLHPRQKPPPQEVFIYGNGFTKAVMNLEDDIAALNIMVANDPRTLNKLVIYKPPMNVISQSELVSLWEEKTGRTLKRVYLPEAEMVKLSDTLPDPDNIPITILHSIFVKGDQTNYEVTNEDVEVTKLYPTYKFTSINDFLDICKVNPPETKLASFV
ncbi:hypothetical protein SUGI_0768590 [Cryptomeria japonica]|uniref:isoeugenol synthase 1 n=1 Tax=Cryptomeria japonica TaxID=3369 RepID=UPI0024148744|nr:isoeugenol synthase 1 [Cryptomeria japonica]GLJ37803.1 hypothetical protein SUGI_0768590 [Cryptomeria japonica]